MSDHPDQLEIFLVAPPGLEAVLCEEACAFGFSSAKASAGGVTLFGSWPDVWRANLFLRGAARVLVRIGGFRVMHLAQLDKRSRKIAWDKVLDPKVPVRVEASCKRSRIYHSKAAAERIATAVHETLGVQISEDAEIVIKARIEDDFCTISLDSSGEGLHKRGHKLEVNKAPMRENLAALFLRQAGFSGDEPVLDPMCGSGTFVIEAAEIGLGLPPGRDRHFAFERFKGFDANLFEKMKAEPEKRTPTARFFGSDRDEGAVRMAGENAKRAGVDALARFTPATVSKVERPDGPAGLVIVNPPYGERIGDRKKLTPLYRSLGQVMLTRFSGWRVGVITSQPDLARATGLPFGAPFPSVDHGGIRVRLYLTDCL